MQNLLKKFGFLTILMISIGGLFVSVSCADKSQAETPLNNSSISNNLEEAKVSQPQNNQNQITDEQYQQASNQAQTVVNTASGPQTGLAKGPLIIKTKKGNLRFIVELAANYNQREIGMMWRTSAPRNTGMLFKYDNPQAVAFWMKNTLIPLDIIYIRPDGTISQINHNAQPLDTSPIPSRENNIYGVLEIAGGEARRLGISEGQKIIHPIFKK